MPSRMHIAVLVVHTSTSYLRCSAFFRRCAMPVQRFVSFAPVHRQPVWQNADLEWLQPTPTMPHLSADAKQLILQQYCAGVRGSGFDALAARFHIRGGGAEVLRWHRRWNGTSQSLEEKARSGRPRILSSAQVKRHVAAAIRNRNRSARPVRYTELLPQVQAATGREMSLRTLQRYGHDEAGGRKAHGKKRTAEERECTETCQSDACCMCAERHALKLTRPRIPTCSVC